MDIALIAYSQRDGISFIESFSIIGCSFIIITDEESIRGRKFDCVMQTQQAVYNHIFAKLKNSCIQRCRTF